MKTINPTESHEKFKADMMEFILSQVKSQEPAHLLAVAAQVVGMLAYFQNGKIVSSNQVTELIYQNIITGNEVAAELGNEI